jgi:hypothetical protein
MVPQKFSDQQLFSLRNHIPIAAVITNLLQVPAKINCGTLRFRCPLCARFNTAINDRTNLARCFDCQKNFNPIDMVMATRKINFVQAVSLLKACEHHPQTQPPGQSKRNPNTADSAPTPPASKPLPLKPVPLADILVDRSQPPPNQADLFSTITEQIAETATGDRISI